MKKNFLLTLFISILFSTAAVFAQSELNPNHSNQNIDGINAMWDLQFQFDVTVASGASGNTGAEYDGTYFYTTRWATNLIHKYDLSGNLVEEFSIPGVSGLRDLAYDGQYFYGGAAANTIYQMDFTNKTLVGTITSPVAVRYIAYDDDNDAFWVGSWADNPTLVSRTGTVLATITTTTSSQYGAAYDNVSPGGPFLWVFDQGGGICPGSLMIIQYSVASGTATGVSYDACNDLSDGIAGGLCSFTNFVPGKFSIGGIEQANVGDDTFFIYEVADVVPVELTSFTATANSGVVLLNWSTASETNNNGFEVQRGNGTDLKTIGFVKGIGTTTKSHSYSFTDQDVNPGTYTYRLKQIDFNGSFSYSQSINATVEAPRIYSLEQNYPNPFNPNTIINFNLATDSKVTLNVYNVLGQQVDELLNSNLAAGFHTINFNASNLNSGVYFYRLEANGINGKSFVSIKKMILTK